MKKIVDITKKYIDEIKNAIVDDTKRCEIMFRWLNGALAVVALIMSAVNIFTAEYILMISTLLFAGLCIVNTFIIKTRINNKNVYLLFSAEAIILLAFFLISGIPNGFSVLWLCLIPSFSLLIFGRKNGSLFCFTALFMMLILFWTPQGRGILMYKYTDTFMLRFPFLYSAIYMISVLVEYVRSETKKQLVDAETKYRYLSCHDALTGLYDRYGFNELIKQAFEKHYDKPVAFMIMDIDNFKNINDKYGHSAGDEVLKKIAVLPNTVLCDKCMYCRWGGEEFTVFMKCEHNPLEIAEKLRESVEKTVIKYEKECIKVTISIGLCIVNDVSSVTFSDIMNEADKCLYKSKENGKNQVNYTVIN